MKPWRALLESAGLLAPGSAAALTRLSGGGNNRVYAVEGTGRSLIIKEYFRDGRDRLGAEWSFLTYAWESGIRVVPEPLLCDPAATLAVYARLPGRHIRAGEVQSAHVEQAAAFAVSLQERRPQADLPDGAEACFSTAQHLELIGRRVKALAAINHAPAAEFVRERLTPTWHRIRARVLGAADDPSEAQPRFVSPSDFGFHNALVDEGGVVRFHDFEYAGWDDAAKLLCDFFCQPEVPVQLGHFETLATGPFATAADRARLLLDAYRVKWCCIMLNDFLPAGARRRRYALGPTEREQRHARQFAKAQDALGAVSP